MLNGSCKRCDTSGGVKKRGRLESSRVKEGGLVRVDFVLLIALLLYLDWRFEFWFVLQYRKWRSLCFDLYSYLTSEWKHRRKSLFPTRDDQRRNRLRCATTKRMWSWSSLILKTVGNWIRLPVYRYWADLTCSSNRSYGITAGHCRYYMTSS